MQIHKPIVFLYLETTGKNPVLDRIVEIACIKIDMNGTQTEKSVRINPMIPIPPSATAIHGITDEIIKGAPKFIEISKSLHEFLFDCDLGGYNSNNFYIPMLIEEFHRCGIVFPTWEPSCIDILQYDRILNPNRLADMYHRYTEKKLEGSHQAIKNIRAILEILVCQVDGNKEITPEDLDRICQDGKKRFDYGGKAYIDKDGIVRWSFGANINKPVLEDDKYLTDYVLKQNFATELKNKLIALRQSKI